MDIMCASRNHNQAKQPVSAPQPKGPIAPRPVHPLIRLQQALGNQAVGRMVQAKLNINQPGDEYEQEADRVADTVMRMPAPQSDDHRLAITPLTSHVAQRKCAECEEEVDEGALQLKESGSAVTAPATAPPIVDQALSSPGQPLDAETRTYFEPRFGQDFSGVRIHTDTHATESARAINARAFTVGQDVVFGAGQYTPETATGRRLLAHELAHVTQQEAAYGKPRQSDVLAREPATPEPSAQGRVEELEGRVEELEGRVEELEGRVEKVEKVIAALLIDLKWANEFKIQLSGCREATSRITNGLENANTHFKEAGINQKEFDTLVTQLKIAAITGGLAFGFEPLFGAVAKSSQLADSVLMKKLGMQIDDLMEYLENPVLQLSSSTADIVGPASDVLESSKPPKPPPARSGRLIGSSADAILALSSSPVDYLTKCIEKIEQEEQNIASMLRKGFETLQTPTDEQLKNFDPEAREARYSNLMARMKQTCRGTENMKSEDEVAIILERHLWAIWIREQDFHTVWHERLSALHPLSTKFPEDYFARGEPGLGSYIAEALNNVGFGSTILPEVMLSSHWHTSHRPDDWATLIAAWALNYSETLEL